MKTPSNSYNICPTCGNPGEGHCKCLRRDTVCKNGHHWHTCTVHNCIVPVEFDHSTVAVLESDCTCTPALIAERKAAGETDLLTICDAYYRVGICYVVRRNDDWAYLFICGKKNRKHFETANIDELLRNNRFMEFKQDMIASY